MRTIYKLLLAVLVIIATGCSQMRSTSEDNHVTLIGSGSLTSQEVAVSDFEQVEAGLTFDLTIHPGEDHSVTLTSDDNFIDYIQVEQTGGTISFGFKPGYAYDISGVTLRADVTMPELTGLRLSGSSHARLNGFISVEDFEAELSGSSFLEGELEAVSASLILSGSTYANMVGSAENLQLDICGNSTADLGSYQIKDATLEASCNSTSVVNAAEKLDVNASQYARVFYTNNPASIIRDVNESAFLGPKE